MSPENTTIKDLLERAVVEVIDHQRLATRLRRGRPLRVKYGIDPTSHYLHLGHAVGLRKLRAFQRAGHQAVLVIGDFTARLGDPSGRDTARPVLTTKQVESFAETYLQQAGKIIDLKRTEVRYNSEWLAAMEPENFIKLLSTTTVQQLLAHETFSNRMRKGLPLGAHEILYPLMQGYDSVAVRADVELGAVEQKFNLLSGREVQRAHEMGEQDVVMVDYLIGTDGRQKMSKTAGNTINLTDTAEDMFGKVMSIPDKLIVPYFTLTTDVGEELISQTKKDLRNKTKNPRDIKLNLAQEVVGQFYSPKETEEAAERFVTVHRKKELPNKMPAIVLRPGKHQLIDVLVSQKIADSRSAARRLVEQGGVKIDRQPVTDWETPIEIKHGTVIEIGKRRFFRVEAVN